MAFKYFLLACMAVASVANAQTLGRIDNFNFNLDNVKEEPPKEVVPILRFIDTQNPDGSYTYGYESGDGTYKIETRFATGEVKGKYGYVDLTGQLREVEYGASPERGFEPRAEGLVVAPPTLADDSDYDYEEPAAPAAPAFAPTPAPARIETRGGQFANFAPRQQTQEARRVVIRKRPVQQQRPAPRASVRPAPRPAPRPAAPRPAPRPAPEAPRSSFRAVPAPVAAAPGGFGGFGAVGYVPVDLSVEHSDAQRFVGHHTQNINLQTGGFVLSYGR